MHTVAPLRNDLHLSYLRTSGMVQGGSRPCSSKSFGSHALAAASHGPESAHLGLEKTNAERATRRPHLESAALL